MKKIYEVWSNYPMSGKRLAAFMETLDDDVRECEDFTPITKLEALEYASDIDEDTFSIFFENMLYHDDFIIHNKPTMVENENSAYTYIDKNLSLGKHFRKIKNASQFMSVYFCENDLCINYRLYGIDFQMIIRKLNKNDNTFASGEKLESIIRSKNFCENWHVVDLDFFNDIKVSEEYLIRANA